jgi:hypothetical protein
MPNDTFGNTRHAVEEDPDRPLWAERVRRRINRRFIVANAPTVSEGLQSDVASTALFAQTYVLVSLTDATVLYFGPRLLIGCWVGFGQKCKVRR